MAEKVVYVKAPRKERAEKIDLNAFFDSALAGGAIAVIYFVGWPLVQKFMKGELKLPDFASILSNIKFPVLGSQLPRSTGSGTPDNTPTTNLWYKANGATQAMPNSRCDNASNRWENVVKWGGLPGYEVVIYFTVPKGSMQTGSHIGLKHGGPHHTSPCDYSTSGACCCWWDTGLRRDGTIYTEVEHPHPSNTHTKYHGNIGRPLDTGETLGVRWHIIKEGSGVRLKQWVDTSGKVQGNQWKPTYDVLDNFDGSLMFADYKSKAFTPTQNIEIRISDVQCKSIKMDYGPMARQITS